MSLSSDPFELRLNNISTTKFHGPTIDVMDTFETVVIGLKGYKVHFTAADAVRLTELILARTRPDDLPTLDDDTV
jgi:hypothetical protein